jgi:uncharacterized protein YjbI with pentapeptide repeats
VSEERTDPVAAAVQDEWRHLEFVQRERHHKEQQRTEWRASRLTAVSVGLTGLSIFVALLLQLWQQHNANDQFRETLQQQQHQQAEDAEQFQQTLQAQDRQRRVDARRFQTSARRDEYRQIVEGLSSSSAAVQDSSMSRLVTYTLNRHNYPTTHAWRDGLSNATQTLTAFIVDESVGSGRVGLSPYWDPQPIIVPRAMNHLRQVAAAAKNDQTIDIGGADLHGAALSNLHPTVAILAAGVDLRRADLSGLDLTTAPSRLNSAFLTCANLAGAQLGPANLAGTDLTGADLSGADLSQVTDLEREQLRGVTISESTKLPAYLPPMRPRVGWRDIDHGIRCYRLANEMTGMRGAQGYTKKIPCARSLPAMAALDFAPAWRGDPADLVDVCQARLGRGRILQ